MKADEARRMKASALALEATAVEAATLRQDDRRGGRSISAHLVRNRDARIITAACPNKRCGNKHDHH
jgi:hypothetical protein